MRILLTGASSFTGYWFARTLVELGHEVVATFTGAAASYRGADRRALRCSRLAELCECVHETRFGDARFLDLLNAGTVFERVCHHGAQVGDYRSADFDVLGAVQANTQCLAQVLTCMAQRGVGGLVLSGTVFERGEGLGTSLSEAASPYGLAKSVTSDLFRYYAARHGVPLAKVVIPNPFGPLEEPRFTAYLMREWLAGRTAEVRTPAYVRDNIHVELLARAYVTFATATPLMDYHRLAPSGYVQTQGEFAQRVALQMRPRLSANCALALAEQTLFDEPRVRINSDTPDALGLGFDEARAWDHFAASYLDSGAG